MSTSTSTPSPSARSDTLSTTGKRIRTSKPKVRSGCVTCKARRIKCDEMKPACDRCTKFGRECGGYKVQLTYEERVAARNGRSRILPKVYQATTTSSHQHIHNHILPTPPPPPPTFNIPLTPQQIFCIETSLELCRILDFPHWTSMKVEMCKQHPFLGHAFSAIRMLSKGPPPTPECIDPQLNDAHDPNLCSLHHNQFLEGSRVALATNIHQPLLASIICLLTISLETLQFRHDPALAHIQLGLSILPQLPQQETMFTDEITHAFRMLETKAMFLDNCFPFYAPMPLGFASPFVVQELFCRKEELVIPEEFEALFGAGEGAFDSRGSSVAVSTP